MGWLRDFIVQQLQELLQTYFGAMRHCLVCKTTVDATYFCCRQTFLSTRSPGTPFVSPRGTQKRLTTEQRKERQTEEAHSFIIDQSIDDSRLDLASLIFKLFNGCFY